METGTKTTTVTRLHNRTPIEWDNIYIVRQLLQDEIVAAIRNRVKIKSIASHCKLSPSTISKLAYGDTKEPRATTVLVLLNYFGYKVTIS